MENVRSVHRNTKKELFAAVEKGDAAALSALIDDLITNGRRPPKTAMSFEDFTIKEVPRKESDPPERYTLLHLLTSTDDNNNSQTPLHIAAELGHTECVRFLLSEPMRAVFRDEVVAGSSRDWLRKAVEGETAAGLGDGPVGFWGEEEAEKGEESEKKDTPRNPPSAADVCHVLRCNRHGTALMTAVHNGHLETARMLIEEFGCDPRAHLMHNWPSHCLHFACQGGHEDLVAYFLAMGIDERGRPLYPTLQEDGDGGEGSEDEKEEEKEKSIMGEAKRAKKMAANAAAAVATEGEGPSSSPSSSSGSSSRRVVFLTNTNRNWRPMFDPAADSMYEVWSPLHYACGSVWDHGRFDAKSNEERIRIVKRLVGAPYNCDPHRHDAFQRYTPLMAAAEHGHESMIRFLVDTYGCAYASTPQPLHPALAAADFSDSPPDSSPIIVMMRKAAMNADSIAAQLNNRRDGVGRRRMVGSSSGASSDEEKEEDEEEKGAEPPNVIGILRYLVQERMLDLGRPSIEYPILWHLVDRRQSGAVRMLLGEFPSEDAADEAELARALALGSHEKMLAAFAASPYSHRNSKKWPSAATAAAASSASSSSATSPTGRGRRGGNNHNNLTNISESLPLVGNPASAVGPRLLLSMIERTRCPRLSLYLIKRLASTAGFYCAGPSIAGEAGSSWSGAGADMTILKNACAANFPPQFFTIVARLSRPEGIDPATERCVDLCLATARDASDGGKSMLHIVAQMSGVSAFGGFGGGGGIGGGGMGVGSRSGGGGLQSAMGASDKTIGRLVDMLVDDFGCDVDATDSSGRTPLDGAASAAAARRLTAHGASVSGPKKKAADVDNGSGSGNSGVQTAPAPTPLHRLAAVRRPTHSFVYGATAAIGQAMLNAGADVGAGALVMAHDGQQPRLVTALAMAVNNVNTPLAEVLRMETSE